MISPYYFNLSDDKRESALGFLLESVLKSRIQLGLKEESGRSDEDVNIYLAFLLLEASTPSFNDKIQHLTSRRNTDVFKMIEDSHDNYFKYLVYKTNADLLLLLLSVFQHVGGEGKGEAAFFEKSQSAYEGYAKTYYSFASEYDRLLHRKITALGTILHKLSQSFGVYEQILINVREAYLKFLQTKEEDFSSFLKELSQWEELFHLKDMQDHFLDTYSAYLKGQDPSLREKLFEIAQKIRRLDPTFQLPPL